MLIWDKYNQGAIFRDKSRGGLLEKFLKDYKEHFGGSINPSCPKCLEKYYTNYINKYIMSKSEVKCDYVLKQKYNGIQLGFGGRPVRNGEMTNEVAKDLIENHPHGEMLFDVFPRTKEKTNDEMKLSELREKYPSITANTRGKFLKKISEIKE